MIVIKNGNIVLEDEVLKGDLLIEGEIIKEIGTEILINDADIIDATDMYVLPGGIDVHTHFNLKSGDIETADNFYFGSRAAIKGGTTSIIDHPGFGPKDCNLSYQIDQYHKYAKNNSIVDYGFHGVVQHINNEVLEELSKLKKEGITSFKGYMTYDYKLSDYDFYKLLKEVKEIGGLVSVHAENDSVIEGLRNECLQNNNVEPIYHSKSRPNILEAEAIDRILKIAKLADNAPIYIVHLSTEEGLQEIVEARDKGQENIYVETCPQYLLLTDSKYEEESEKGVKYILSPPLRKYEDVNALWEGIRNHQIDIVATDHCAFKYPEDKLIGVSDFSICPNGGPGVQERMIAMFSEGYMKDRITINRLSEILSVNPSKICGLYPQKGTIKEGSDADIVIINPNDETKFSENNIESNSNYTMYGDYNFKGKIDKVILRGNVLVENDEIINNSFEGKYIKRQ